MAATQTDAPLGTRRKSMDIRPEFRLVLVGKTGAGKSSSGNTILGRDAFSAAVTPSSVTRLCCKHSGQVFDRPLTVVDTPGLFDTSLPEHLVKREISKCINMSAPGPHAILLVIKVGPFTVEEQDAVRQVEQIFGEDAWRYTIVLFTQDSSTAADVEQQLGEAGAELRSILRKVENRYHVLNNDRADDRGQVLDLLEKVETMVEDNRGGCYSNYTYLQVVEMLERREAELRDFYQRQMQEKIKAVEVKYQRMLTEPQQERPGVKRRRQAELKEVERFYDTLQRDVRHVVELAAPSDTTEDIQKFHMTFKLKVTN